MVNQSRGSSHAQSAVASAPTPLKTVPHVVNGSYTAPRPSRLLSTAKPGACTAAQQHLAIQKRQAAQSSKSLIILCKSWSSAAAGSTRTLLWGPHEHQLTVLVTQAVLKTARSHLKSASRTPLILLASLHCMPLPLPMPRHSIACTHWRVTATNSGIHTLALDICFTTSCSQPGHCP